MSTETVPHVGVTPQCPILHQVAGVELDLNIFREKETFTGCSLLHTGEDCSHECLATPEAKRSLAELIKIEQAKHLKDLGTVGPDVLV
ncbi:MAG: hypothetical protein Q7J45_04270 [bacterium]|nr:hypothetical protein [bacterium]